MVSAICPLDNADVSAGTANAARIAIIAITTSSSIRVNAEGLCLSLFIGVCLGVARLIPHSSQIKSTFIFRLSWPSNHRLPAFAKWLRVTGEQWQGSWRLKCGLRGCFKKADDGANSG